MTQAVPGEVQPPNQLMQTVATGNSTTEEHTKLSARDNRTVCCFWRANTQKTKI